MFISMMTSVKAQDFELHTESTSLNQLIIYIANEIKLSPEPQEDSRHFTFLIETHQSSLSVSDKALLKQNFKFLCERLSTKDKISIAFYNSLNGLLIDKLAPSEVKKLLHAIDSEKLAESFTDGISETYSYANKNVENFTKNTLIFVTNPSPKAVEIPVEKIVVSKNLTEPTPVKNNGTGTVVLLTAISLLPELINVIKD